jgi:hypothetical protein
MPQQRRPSSFSFDCSVFRSECRERWIPVARDITDLRSRARGGEQPPVEGAGEPGRPAVDGRVPSGVDLGLDQSGRAAR